jgi:hypothetical protein
MASFFRRECAFADRLDADQLIRGHHDPIEHRLNSVSRRGHDGKAVGPLPAVEVFLDGCEIVRGVGLRKQRHALEQPNWRASRGEGGPGMIWAAVACSAGLPNASTVDLRPGYVKSSLMMEFVA